MCIRDRYQGDFTMYGGAGLRTQFGGDIQLLTPGGQQVLGIEGAAPPATAGVVTQGQGDIQLYALGSVLLGQSRIMTTFGLSLIHILPCRYGACAVKPARCC